MQKLSVQHYDDFLNVKISTICFAIVLLYFIILYFYTRPKKDLVIPLFKPPEGISPAQVAFLLSRGYQYARIAVSYPTVTAALISLAVKERIAIEFDGYHSAIKRTSNRVEDLPAEEVVLMKYLENKAVLELTNVKSDVVSAKEFVSVVRDFHEKLKDSCSKYFFPHWIAKTLSWVIVGFALLEMAPFLIEGNDLSSIFKLSLGLTAIFYLIVTVIKKPKYIKGLFGIPFIVVLTVLFAGPSALLKIDISDIIVICLVAGMITLPLSYRYKGYTKLGHKALAEIQGYKLYLSTAEKEYFNLVATHEYLSKALEKELPYAIALGLENSWAETFRMEFVEVWITGTTDEKNRSLLERPDAASYLSDLFSFKPPEDGSKK